MLAFPLYDRPSVDFSWQPINFASTPFICEQSKPVHPRMKKNCALQECELFFVTLIASLQAIGLSLMYIANAIRFTWQRYQTPLSYYIFRILSESVLFLCTGCLKSHVNIDKSLYIHNLRFLQEIAPVPLYWVGCLGLKLFTLGCISPLKCCFTEFLKNAFLTPHFPSISLFSYKIFGIQYLISFNFITYWGRNDSIIK